MIKSHEGRAELSSNGRAYVHLDNLENGGRGLSLQTFAEAISNLVFRPEVREMLLARNLHGVIRRHSGTPADSYHQLQRVTGSRAEAQGIDAFAILDSETNQVKGMASVQADLDLWSPRFPRLRFPTHYTRNSVLGEKVETPTYNVSAWDVEGPEVLAGAYYYLRDWQPDCWTIEPPSRSDSSVTMIEALNLAGFSLRRFGPLDDGETTGAAAPAMCYWVGKGSKQSPDS